MAITTKWHGWHFKNDMLLCGMMCYMCFQFSPPSVLLSFTLFKIIRCESEWCGSMCFQFSPPSVLLSFTLFKSIHCDVEWCGYMCFQFSPPSVLLYKFYTIKRNSLWCGMMWLHVFLSLARVLTSLCFVVFYTLKNYLLWWMNEFI